MTRGRRRVISGGRVLINPEGRVFIPEMSHTHTVCIKGVWTPQYVKTLKFIEQLQPPTQY